MGNTERLRYLEAVVTVVQLDERRPRGETLKVSEIFGPTLQGEGPSAGRRCSFVRLGLCNLDCSFCDTPFTWDWNGKNGTAYDRKAELTTMAIYDVIDEVDRVANNEPMMVVISGGEPLVQAAGLDSLVDKLLDSGVATCFEIETNGTFIPSPLLKLYAMPDGPLSFNVSPKLGCSGVDPRKAIVPEALRLFTELQASFKFVVASADDIAEIVQLQATGDIRGEDIWIMPEGISAETINKRFPALFDTAVKNGWSCSTRLHVLAHNDERGF